MVVPIDIVANMKRQGLTNNQIVQNLQREGYDSSEILDALNQTETKAAIDPGMESYMPSGTNLPEETSQDYSYEEQPILPPAPSPTYRDYAEPYQEYPQESRAIEDEIEAIAEQVVEEKWAEFIERTGDLALWKSDIQRDVDNLRRDIKNLNQQIANLQQAIIGKVNDYNKSLKEVGAEIKAMDQVFQKILPTLTTNVKELSSITERVRKKKKR